MNFGEKLFKLRKEKGLSQEAVAEQVGTTRQAISKWENGQGFPETEKLMMLGNIFEVSIDYLLKDNECENIENNAGYYVSKEVAYGYLTNEKRNAKYIALGFSSWILTGVPYLMLQNSWRIVVMAVFIVLGISFFVVGCLKDETKYAVLKKEPLIFDSNFIKQLTTEYEISKKKYHALLLASVILIAGGIIPIFVTLKGMGFGDILSEYHAISFLIIAFGFFGFVHSVSHMEAYEFLVKNDEYSNRFLVKFSRKFKNKFDKF
ncbi:helix-turn-helix domain-containing protein [Clostridium sp. MB05]|jgi:transcriptional regulator with XRE-family HTH domain